MDESHFHRPKYRPSGRFEPISLAAWLGALLGLALLLAAGLAWAVRLDGYALGYIWMLPIVLLISFVRRAVANANCRSRTIGAMAGLVAGGMTLAGMYHIDQCTRWGVGWERVDRLPGYVTFRMETDGLWWPDGRMPCLWALPFQENVKPYLEPKVSDKPNWFVVLAELVFFLVIPAAVAWARADRPFSERTHRWYSRDLLILTKTSAAGLRQALQEGSLAEWAEQSLIVTMTHDDHVKVTVWYCPRPTEADEPEPDVYLSFGDRPVHLSPEESAAIASCVPALADLAIPVANRFGAPGQSTDDPTLAQFLHVPGEHVGRAKKKSVIYLGRVGMFAIAISPVAVLFLVALGAWGLHLLFDWLGIPNEALIVIVGIVGIALLIAVKRMFNPENDITWRFLVWYYRREIAAEAAAREDALFPPDRPDVIYTEMIPRRAWADTNAHRSECEGGLMVVDAERQMLLYEGDRYRYVVPAASIRRYAVEEVVMANAQTGTTAGFFAVVLVVRAADGDRELPLCPLDGVAGYNRWEKANALCDQITSAFGWSQQPAETSPPAGHLA